MSIITDPLGILARASNYGQPAQQAPPIMAAQGTYVQGPYVTQLAPQDEAAFQSWVTANKIPWQDSPTADYDMRGYWQAMQAGDPNATRAANLHFPDTYKTPYHKSFSNESKYATPNAPAWSGNKLVAKDGTVVFDETPALTPATAAAIRAKASQALRK